MKHRLTALLQPFARFATLQFPTTYRSRIQSWICMALLVASTAAHGAVSVGKLRCEYLANPEGLDVVRPRLSWILDASSRGTVQTGYQVLAASTAELLKQNRGDLWDSGKVESDQSIHVEYGGKPLRAGQQCFWKVRVWAGSAKASRWSDPARWSIGLLNSSDWKGQWIGNPVPANDLQLKAPLPAPLLRKSFDIKRPVRRATAYICGLGYYEMELNGSKVGNRVLDPMITQYDKRAAYVTHDVTRLLNRGKNAVGVTLGNSWYNATVSEAWDFDKAPWRAQPQLLLQMNIEYADGSSEQVVSDSTWKISSGPIVFDQLRVGEFHDARLEKPGWSKPGFDDSGWSPAAVREGPKAILTAANVEPIRVMKTLEPVSVKEPKPGVFVFDLGQNIAGWPRLRVKGAAGTTVQMKCGERLNPDGTLDQKDIAQHVRSTDFQLTTYTLKGQGTEVWEPRFTFHGFQYVQLEGFPGKPDFSAIEGRVVHTAFERAGSFKCSNDLLNKIQTAALWSYVGNFVGFPSDCPHREKNGWTGDAQLIVQMGLEYFGAQAAYTEWLRDVGSMVRADGKLPSIVPTGGWGYNRLDGPAWESAFVLIPWELYLQAGDHRILETHYDGFKQWIGWYSGIATNHIVNYGLGDWCPARSQTPRTVTSTAYYHQCLRIISKTADLLGKIDEARHYAKLADNVRSAFNTQFFNAETGLYANGTQTALSCALYQDLVDDPHRSAVSQNLAEQVRTNGHRLDVGILGSKYLLRALSDHGHFDVAWKVATQTNSPSWGNWIMLGANTLWEDWPGAMSRNHIMFGDISSWFMEYLAGIRYDSRDVAYKRILIQPNIADDLTWARATRESMYGTIRSEWKRSPDRFDLNVTVPANTTATVVVPGVFDGNLRESGRRISGARGVKVIRQGLSEHVLEVGSGTYRFRLERR
ncbi:MAG TPA: family 78 glycoside hydrolase catalytic domain [Verrucomicrobiae bacterium]|nr:family 78 glycoside hydrolase catalytic domain [Verrucomicrobiae bacterium]